MAGSTKLKVTKTFDYLVVVENAFAHLVRVGYPLPVRLQGLESRSIGLLVSLGSSDS